MRKFTKSGGGKRRAPALLVALLLVVGFLPLIATAGPVSAAHDESENFNVEWHIVRDGIIRKVWEIDVQNLDNTKGGRSMSISSLISDTSFNISELKNVKFYEWKDWENVEVPVYDNVAENCTIENVKNYKVVPPLENENYSRFYGDWNENNFAIFYVTDNRENVAAGYENKYKLPQKAYRIEFTTRQVIYYENWSKNAWKPCKMQLFENTTVRKENYGQINIPRFGSRAKLDNFGNVTTENGIKRFRIEFDVPIQLRTGGWGSSGLVRLEIDGVLYGSHYVGEIGSSWWDLNWKYSKKIEIDNAKVDANLDNFPVLVNLTSDSDLQSHVGYENGQDIAFVNSDNTVQFDHEIENYDNSAGNLAAFFRIPTLSSTENTIIYMYYGNASATSQENPTGVWDDNFVMVQHMNDAIAIVEFKEKLDWTDLDAYQGVASDGTYLYTVSSTWYLDKWTKDGTRLYHVGPIPNTDAEITHVGDLCYHNNKLYLACSNYPTSTIAKIFVYNASDLTYDTKYNITENMGTVKESAGIAYNDSDGFFWVTTWSETVNAYVRKFNTSFEYENEEHDLGYKYSQGIDWHDNKLYVSCLNVVAGEHYLAEFDNFIMVRKQHLQDHTGIGFEPNGENLYFGTTSALGNYKIFVYWVDGTDTSSIKDSTSNNNDGIKKGADEPIECDGQIYKAQDFDGNDYINVAGPSVSSPNITVEAWLKTDSVAIEEMITTLYQTSTNETAYFWVANGTPDFKIYDTGGGSHEVAGASNFSVGTWYHLVGSFDGSNLRLYVNGSEDGNSPLAWSGDFREPIALSGIGYRKEHNDIFWDGILDEIRISNVTRSAGWILTTFNNQSDPSSFYAVGAEESAPSANDPPSAPTNLWCESQTNPTCIIDLTPEFSAIGTDNEGDKLTYYRLEVDNDSGFGSTIWDSGKASITDFDNGTRCEEKSYAGDALSRGVTYYWRVKFWDNHDAEGLWSTEEATFKINSLPTAPTEIILYPDPVYVNDELWGTASGSTDADGDELTYYYLFWNQADSVVRQNWSTDNSYVIQAVDAHDAMYVYVKAADVEYGENNDNFIVVSNEPPTTPTSLALTPDPCYITDELTGSGDGSTDDDGDGITYYYAFYNERASAMRQDWSVDDSYTLVVVLDAHDNIRVFVRAYDGYEYSDNIENSLIIADSLPTNATTILLSPDPIYVGDTLTANASGATDADDDMISYLYAFYNENETSMRQAYGIIDTYTIQQIDAHDNIQVFVKIGAIGWGGSAGPYPDNSIIIGNIKPIAENQETDGETNPVDVTSDTPVLSWDYCDNDADTQENFQIQVGTAADGSDMWDNNQQNSDSFITYAGAALTESITYYWRVRVYDNHEWSDWLSGGTFVITPNEAPDIPTIDSPADGYDATVGEGIGFSGSATDPDGDELEYEWDFGDGTGTSDEADTTHTYSSPGHFTVTLTVTDPSGETSTITIIINVTSAGGLGAPGWTPPGEEPPPEEPPPIVDGIPRSAVPIAAAWSVLLAVLAIYLSSRIGSDKARWARNITKCIIPMAAFLTLLYCRAEGIILTPVMLVAGAWVLAFSIAFFSLTSLEHGPKRRRLTKQFIKWVVPTLIIFTAVYLKIGGYI